MDFINQLQEFVAERLDSRVSKQPLDAEEDEAEKIKALSTELDVDQLDSKFTKFAGLDDCLSKSARAASVSPPVC